MALLKLPIACPHCKAAGYTVWQGDGLDRARWLPVEISHGFHEEVFRTVTGKSVIVCNTCDEILPD